MAQVTVLQISSDYMLRVTLLLVDLHTPDAGGVCGSDDHLPFTDSSLAELAPVLHHLLPGCMLQGGCHAMLIIRVCDGDQRNAGQEDVCPVCGLIEACNIEAVCSAISAKSMPAPASDSCMYSKYRSQVPDCCGRLIGLA